MPVQGLRRRRLFHQPQHLVRQDHSSEQQGNKLILKLEVAENRANILIRCIHHD